jgi:hypothetical protein
MALTPVNSRRLGAPRLSNFPDGRVKIFSAPENHPIQSINCSKIISLIDHPKPLAGKGSTLSNRSAGNRQRNSAAGILIDGLTMQ